MPEKLKVIDLFSGCGGLSYGFIEAGYEVLIGLDHWKDAVATFEHNHKGAIGMVADLSTISPDEVEKVIGTAQVDVIIGGPPCQGFSIAGKREVSDERNKLYKNFVDFVAHFKPQAFLMENVANIVSMGKGSVKENIISDFEALGYHVVYKVLTASDYGVPQNRKRAIFVGMLKNSFVFPAPTTPLRVTSGEAISDLGEHSLINGTAYPIAAASPFQQQIREGSDGIYNHETSAHSEQTVNIISLVPDGGNYKSLPDHLKDTRRVNIAWTRLNSERPSFTIDTGHRHHFHYVFNRIPTVRESARIQSFPDKFIFLGSKTSQYKQVGNAVPPILAKHLAETLKEQLER